MPKKIIITTLIVLITIMFPVNLKASLIPKEISRNYILQNMTIFLSNPPQLSIFLILHYQMIDLFLRISLFNVLIQ